MAFHGIPPDLFAFYADLSENNERTWFRASKRRYEESVKEPLAELANELEDAFGPIHVFRPNRDVRFSKDKTPYKEQASLGPEVNPMGGGLILWFGAEGLTLAAGRYQPEPEVLARFRAVLDDEITARSIDNVLRELAEDGIDLDEGNPVKTAPRGYNRDHPRIELLRRRQLTVRQSFEPAAWMHEPECADRIVDGWRAVDRWNAWLSEHVT